MEESDFQITQALHSYFNVGDISQCFVTGLDSKTYLDMVGDSGNGQSKVQQGKIAINSEVDRIYLDTGSVITIEDNHLNRRIVLTSKGSQSAVVWNPWKALSVSSSDLKDDAYRYFLCVETTNAANDVVSVDSGGEYTLAVEYRIENLA
jgi:glucose-6-phosphate 1-epimerase